MKVPAQSDEEGKQEVDRSQTGKKPRSEDSRSFLGWLHPPPDSEYVQQLPVQRIEIDHTFWIGRNRPIKPMGEEINRCRDDQDQSRPASHRWQNQHKTKMEN